jgi:hypothetical protein
LDIVRPVLNIDEGVINDLQERTLMKTDGSSRSYDAISQLLSPVDALRATIISNNEFLRLQRYFNSGLSEGGMRQMLAQVAEVVPTADQPMETPTLPARFHRGKVKALTIAGSEAVLDERAVAKQILLNFFQAGGVPREVWEHSSAKLSRVWLAYSRKSRDEGLLQKLQRVIEADPGILPETTELGPMQLRLR